MHRLFAWLRRWLGRPHQHLTPPRLYTRPQPEGEPGGSRGGLHFEDWRDRLDANEFFEAEQSRTQSSFEIREVSAQTPRGRTVRRLTPAGFATDVAETLLKTNTGRIITPEQLVGGGQCAICGGFTDERHYYQCTLCGLGLCQTHVYFFTLYPLCPRHARSALYHMNAWLDRGGKIRPC